jgi:hypothetical protein
MNLQIEGKIIQILEPKSGESRNGKWLKQEFVIETQETYPRKVCLQVWNDKADLLKQFSTGETIVASINIESREYNERWYTDIKAWKLEKPNSQTPAPSKATPLPEDDMLPPEANVSPRNDAPMAEEDDGLPF